MGDPFDGNAPQHALGRLHGGKRLLVKREAKLRLEPACAKDAKGVFGKAFLRVPDRADDSSVEISQAVKFVDEAADWVVGNSVDGEIAARQILLDSGDERNFVRMASVGIGTIASVRRYFDGVPFDDDGKRPVSHPGFMGSVAGGFE